MTTEYFLFVHHTTSILAKLSTWCFEHSGDISCCLLVNPSHSDEFLERWNMCLWIHIKPLILQKTLCVSYLQLSLIIFYIRPSVTQNTHKNLGAQWVIPTRMPKNILNGQVTWTQAYWNFKTGNFLTLTMLIYIYFYCI